MDYRLTNRNENVQLFSTSGKTAKQMMMIFALFSPASYKYTPLASVRLQFGFFGITLAIVALELVGGVLGDVV